ncbi:MAG TPA: LON peptidase substrate-binding domain-containing protein [Tepidisphaeraceae bacterium]|jgi:Lon protease-like protein
MKHPMDPEDYSAVPLFPLPNVVLFPGAVLPLHIFEERYKVMMVDALRGPRLLAMALLRPGWEKNYHGRPSIEPVVCVGSIISQEKLPDGRYNFLLRGQQRCRVVREHGDEPYRVGWLEAIAESDAMEIDFADDRRRLESVFQSPVLGLSSLGRKFQQLLAGPTSTIQIADLVAFYFLEDLQLKQSLLAEPDPRTRVTRVVQNFESLHSIVQGTFPVGISGNPSMN